jgi:hypothetical protein
MCFVGPRSKLMVDSHMAAKAESHSSSAPKKLNLVFDANFPVEPPNLVCSETSGTSFAQPAILNRSAAAWNGNLASGQLAELQSGRLSLKHAVRALSEDLQTLEVVIHNGCQTYFLQAKTNDATLIDETAPPVHEAIIDGQHRYYTVQEEIWDYLLSAARRTQVVLTQVLTLVRRAQHWVSDLISILIRQLARLACSLFCSVSWERRRWFLCHTSHPPKASRPAVAGLFLGACFGSPLA